MRNTYTRIIGLLCFFVFTVSANPGILGDYPVIRGERPPVDIDNITREAYEPGKLLVKFKPEFEELIPDKVIKASKGDIVRTGVAVIDKLNSQFGASSYRPLMQGLYDHDSKSLQKRENHKAWGFHLWFEVELDSKSDVVEAVKGFSRLEEVETAEPVYRKRIIAPVPVPDTYLSPDQTKPGFPDDPRYEEQWHYNNTGQTVWGQTGIAGIDISLEAAWQVEKGRPDVIVAIFDDGMDFAHEDLAANVWEDIGPEGENTQAFDHATHVAGTVAAVTNNSKGVAGIAGGTGEGDGVRLMTLDILEGEHEWTDLALYTYAADNGAAISQNSWGYTQSGVYNQSALDGIDYFNTYGGGEALIGGGITIFAAGNDDDDGKWYPAYYEGAMAVASYDNRGIRSGFSNYGEWIDISAPGTGILSTLKGNSYGLMQGTSMACPHVSGVAALVISNVYGLLSPQELWDILVNNVDDIYQYNDEQYQGKLGSGGVNAYEALMAAQAFLGRVAGVQAFSATPDGHSHIDLSWSKNEDNDDVMITWSQDGTFGTPVEGYEYSSGEAIDGGGTVLYRGGDLSSSHSGLNPDTRYYYRAFSYDTDNNYSLGRDATAVTDRQKHLVTFNVQDTDENPLKNAMIIVAPGGNSDKGVFVKAAGEQGDDAIMISRDVTVQGRDDEIKIDHFEPAKSYLDEDGTWIHWDDGVYAGAIGIDANVIFSVASRWESADIAEFDGQFIRKLKFFIGDIPTSTTAKIWQGPDEAGLVEVYSQEFTPVELSWVEVNLAEPYKIDVSKELWFGYEIEDPGAGVFPAGRDQTTDHDGKGNKLKRGQMDWENLTDVGLSGDWLIRAFLIEPDTLYTDASGSVSIEKYSGIYYYTAGKDSYTDIEGNFTVDDEPLQVNLVLEYAGPELPAVTTLPVSDLTATTATGGGDVTDDGGADVTARGVVWGTGQGPTLEENDGITEDGTGTGEFVSELTGLTPETTYYVRAWATNSEGTAYGGQVEFITPFVIEFEAPDGSGTEEEPYLIETLGNLRWIFENPGEWNKHYRQVADIDASETEYWNGGQGWQPIGHGSSEYFQGTYDGDSKTISGLYIKQPTTGVLPHGAGLFYVLDGATIKNLNIENADIFGAYNAGILAGVIRNSTTVINCHSSGSVVKYNDGSSEGSAGGLAGEARSSEITGSSSSAKINGHYRTGGLIGFCLLSEISNSYSEGRIEGYNVAGGLVGENENGIIKQSFSSGNVNGNNTLGGLAGSNTGINALIEDSYSVANILGASYIGGLAGFNINGASITNCYSTGSIYGTGTAVGGFLGGQATNAEVENSFWDIRTSGQETSAGGDGVRGLETYLLLTDLNYLDAGWDFDQVWAIDDLHSYPYNQWQTIPGPHNYPPEFFTLALRVDPADAGIVAEEKEHPAGGYVTVTVIPNEGFRFDRWVDDEYNQLSTDTEFTYIMPERDVTLTAEFTPVNLTVKINPPAGGTVTVSPVQDYYDIGDEVTLTATSASGYRFVNWTDYDNNVLGDQEVLVYTFDQETIELTANFAEQFAGGSGTEADPWLVETAEHLDNVRSYTGSNNSDKHFLQIADIDLNIAPYNEGSGWEPIGTGPASFFHGTYDGEGYKIEGIYINREGVSDQGLFSMLDEHALVKNIDLVDVNIAAGDNAGALAGNLSSAVVRNINVSGTVEGNTKVGLLAGRAINSIAEYCSTTGSVSGQGDVGGLVGLITGSDDKILYCNSHAEVNSDGANAGGLVGRTVSWENDHPLVRGSFSTGNVTNSGQNSGGLVGRNQGTIDECYSSGSVEGADWFVGGLVGYMDRGTVTGSYSTGRVTSTRVGESYAGGLVGVVANGTVENSYSTGDVTGDRRVGGFAGQITSGKIINTYSTGKAEGDTYVGGLVGYNADEGISEDSYWNIETSWQTESAAGEGKSTTEMLKGDTFTEWDFAETWALTEEESYPWLQWQTAPGEHNTTALFNLDIIVSPEGAGTFKGDGLKPGGGLIGLSAYPGDGVVFEKWANDEGDKLSTDTLFMFEMPFEDITLTAVFDVRFAGGRGTVDEPWLIETATHLDNLRHYLGSENGDRHFRQIADINLDIAPYNEGEGWDPIGIAWNDGFYGTYDGNGQIIEGLYINRPERNFAGLFGYVASALISDISIVDARLRASQNVGIIAGYMHDGSVITGSFSTGSVTGSNNVGGLAGLIANSSITDSYAASDVTGDGSVGGLAGRFNGGSVTNCYSTGKVEGDYNVGGLVGYKADDAIIENSFWNIETSWQGESAGGEGKITVEMMNDEVFAGWDFADTWSITEEESYPWLQWQTAPDEHNMPELYDLTILVSPPDAGTVKGDGLRPGGGLIELSAYFDVGVVLEKWTDEDGTELSSEALFMFEMPYEDVTLTAVFDMRFAGGRGTAEEPWLIETADHLDNVRHYLGSENSDRHFMQIADIDLDIAPFNEGRGWEPLGENMWNYQFNGSYYGNGHKIEGLYINRPDSDNTGLFGYVVSAVISDLGVVDARARGNKNVGILAGYLSEGSIITGSFSAGEVSGASAVGGLVGGARGNENRITDSYSIASCSGDWAIGGLAGFIYDVIIRRSFSTGNISGVHDIGGFIGSGEESVIDNCYSTGNVYGDYRVGGFAGYFFGRSLRNSYSTGRVTGDWATGGFAGDADEWGITGSYWNTESSGRESSAGGEGRTTSEMISEATYTGWDFDDTWNIEEDETYPWLVWQLEAGSHNYPAAAQVTLTINIIPGWGGTVNIDPDKDYYEENDSVYLVAIPNEQERYLFVNWTGPDDVEIGTEPELLFIMPDKDVVLTANFDVANTVIDPLVAGDLQISPNPASDFIVVEAGLIIDAIRLIDISGQILRHIDVNGYRKKVDLRGLAPGVYIIQAESGDKVFTRRIAVTR